MGKNRTAENHARKMRAFTDDEGNIMSRATRRFQHDIATGKTPRLPAHLRNMRGVDMIVIDEAQHVGTDYSGGVHDQGPPPGPAREQWKRDNFVKHYSMGATKLAEQVAAAPELRSSVEAELKARRSAAARKAAETRKRNAAAKTAQ